MQDRRAPRGRVVVPNRPGAASRRDRRNAAEVVVQRERLIAVPAGLSLPRRAVPMEHHRRGPEGPGDLTYGPRVPLPRGIDAAEHGPVAGRRRLLPLPRLAVPPRDEGHITGRAVELTNGPRAVRREPRRAPEADPRSRVRRRHATPPGAVPTADQAPVVRTADP